MEERDDSIGARYLERRVEKKGLKPRYAASLIAIVWLIAIAAFGLAEHLIDKQTFNTVWEGMWWATQTVTTVGYGDVVPQGAGGRLVATILMVGGLSLFAVITGTITSTFVTRAQQRSRAGTDAALEEKIDALRAELAALREQIGRD